jgi:hypothetical protein
LQASKKLLLILVLFVLIRQAAAFGIVPGYKTMVYEPNTVQDVPIKVLNEELQDIKVMIYAEGELAPYVEISEPVLELSKGEASRISSYKVKMPAAMGRQGQHETNIVIRTIPKETKPGETSISASVAVISKLYITVPYSGKYVEARLFVPNFQPDSESSFGVEMNNLGTEDILKAKAIINIYGPTNEKVATVISEEVTLKSKEKKLVIILWKPTIRQGNYKAVATVIADTFNAMDERPFSIGKLGVGILGITVNNFKLGGIAQFDILLENPWNERVPNVFGEVSVMDKSGTVYTKFKTASVDINPQEKQEIQAYWDTATVAPGAYKLDVALNYLGEKTEKVFDILVSMNEIKTSLVGQVVGVGEKKETNIILTAIYVLTALVIVLIVLNVLMYLKKNKK